MAVLEVTKNNFNEEVLNSDKKVLVDFWASWCGPCKMIAPVVEGIANENNNIKVVKVNVDEEGELAAQYQIMSIPTLVVIENGEIVNKSVGLISKSEIQELVK
ncbi:MAG: thioredoxin [Lachnospiraceae bacterium]|nr:thioredoxin [Lachnospiraceae bacterium]